MAPTVEWQLPPSVSLVSEEWPVPQKFDHEGLITFGYAETLPLMATLKLDPQFQGKEVEFQAAVSWVICSQDTCLPGSQALSYKVSVGKNSQKGDAHKKVFADADSKLPKKLSPIFVEKNGEEFKIALPISKIDHLEFFPEPDLGFDHHAPLTIDRNASEDYTLITLKTDQGKLPRSLGVLVADQTAFSLETLLDGADDHSYLSMADPVAKPMLPEEESLGLGWALLFSLAGGLLLNLMPCVLPVVSLKVLSFVQMAGSSRKELFKQGALFSSGVLVSFWALAGVLIALQMSGEAVGWGFQLQEPIFVALLAFLFVLLALSLFGVFEMGTSIAAMAGDASQGKSGSKSSSSFLSGVFATAVATPCTGPFMGTALGYALTQPPHIALLVFTALGLGMSLPYLLLGLNPGLLRYIPKPGDWMEAFKQLMGFLMLTTVVWLLWVFAGQTSENSLFILLFALLTASISAWIYGRWGAPYKSKKTRRAAYVVAMAVLVISFWVASGAVKGDSTTTHDQIAMAGDGWEPFSPQRVEELRAQNIPVFIDFTAKWCLICQANHLTLTKENVESRMAEKGVVRMKADWTKHDPVITEELKKFGRSGVPLYVYYGTDKQDAVILPQVLTDSSIISAVGEENSVR
jgi:thiol:disulfide interchange protein